jgi:hypothetical protein
VRIRCADRYASEEIVESGAAHCESGSIGTSWWNAPAFDRRYVSFVLNRDLSVRLFRAAVNTDL